MKELQKSEEKKIRVHELVLLNAQLGEAFLEI